MLAIFVMEKAKNMLLTAKHCVLKGLSYLMCVMEWE